MMQRLKVAVTTAADGSATAYSPRVAGKIHSITYEKVDFADGIDVTITDEKTGEAILSQTDMNASVTKYPRTATHSTAGAAALYASGGVGVLEKVAVANSRIKIVIAQGGNAKTGNFHILVDLG